MSQEKTARDSHVEVVADQSEDGTYEIRIERQSGAMRAVVPHAEPVSLKAHRAESGSGGSRRTFLTVAVAAAAVAALTVGVIVATAGGRTAAPPVVEPAPVPTFQAFTIQVPPPPPTLSASVLAFDVGVDGQGTDAGSGEGEDEEGSGETGALGADPLFVRPIAFDELGADPALLEGAPIDEPIGPRDAERMRAVSVSATAVFGDETEREGAPSGEDDGVGEVDGYDDEFEDECVDGDEAELEEE